MQRRADQWSVDNLTWRRARPPMASRLVPARCVECLVASPEAPDAMTGTTPKTRLQLSLMNRDDDPRAGRFPQLWKTGYTDRASRSTVPDEL